MTDETNFVDDDTKVDEPIDNDVPDDNNGQNRSVTLDDSDEQDDE